MKFLIQSLTRCWKSVSKSVSFLKVLIHKLFFSFFSISWFLRNRITEEVAFLRDRGVEKWFSASKSFIKSFFLCESSSLQMWSVVKLFFRNLTRSKISIRNCRVVKKWLWVWRLWKIDSKHDALYKKWFKNCFFSKTLIQNYFINKKDIFRNNFGKKAQKTLLWRFYGEDWLN